MTYDIHDSWASYELHPETPPNGILISERFKGYDLSELHDQLRQRGQEFGIVFGNRTLLSNSRLSLEASEYARDKGKYKIFHDSIFHAYFTDAQDIGNIEVIKSVATKNGLDSDNLVIALNDCRYRSRLADARKEGEMINLTGVPTFIINGEYKIVGAQPLDVFKEIFNKIR